MKEIIKANTTITETGIKKIKIKQVATYSDIEVEPLKINYIYFILPNIYIKFFISYITCYIS